MMRLRIITLNTWKGDGAYHQRLQWMAAGLKGLSPDIVLLQEAFRCPGQEVDTASRLAEGLGLFPHRLISREKERLFDGQMRHSSSDLCTLLPDVSVSAQKVRLADHSLDKDRWAQSLDFVSAGVSFRVINTHFTHVRDEEGNETREIQAKTIAKLATEKEIGIVILGGDLNTTPDKTPVSLLKSMPGIVVPSVTDPRGTMHGERHGSELPLPRIDFLFVREVQPSGRVKSVQEQIVLNHPVGPLGEYPSDHAGVMIDLELSDN